MSELKGKSGISRTTRCWAISEGRPLSDPPILKQYYGLEAQIIETYIRRIAPAFDSLLVIAEKDACSLRKLFSNPLIEVPSTVDVKNSLAPSLDELQRQGTYYSRDRCVTGRTGKRYGFLSRRLPVIKRNWEKITFHVVGDQADGLGLIGAPGVVFTGFVKD